jgi:serine/threonine protein kinase
LWEQDGHGEYPIFLVMDYMPMTLYQRLNDSGEKPLTKDDVKILLYNLLRSLSFIHSAGVMHRDIKPCNILVDEELNVKICDFGFSRGVVSPAPSPPDQ